MPYEYRGEVRIPRCAPLNSGIIVKNYVIGALVIFKISTQNSAL